MLLARWQFLACVSVEEHNRHMLYTHDRVTTVFYSVASEIIFFLKTDGFFPTSSW
jgi:hypothetical protein